MSCPIPRTLELSPAGELSPVARRIAGESPNWGANRGTNKEPKPGEKPSWPTTRGNILAGAMEKRFGILADPSGFARVFSGVNPKRPVKSTKFFKAKSNHASPRQELRKRFCRSSPLSNPCHGKQPMALEIKEVGLAPPHRPANTFHRKEPADHRSPKTVRLQRLGRALK